ncbi:hypothetical protein ACI3PL_09335, partial [Lacticaseibacillus paracasei]
TAEPHLAYDCSALAPGSLDISKSSMRDQKRDDFHKSKNHPSFKITINVNLFQSPLQASKSVIFSELILNSI